MRFFLLIMTGFSIGAGNPALAMFFAVIYFLLASEKEHSK